MLFFSFGTIVEKIPFDALNIHKYISYIVPPSGKAREGGKNFIAVLITTAITQFVYSGLNRFVEKEKSERKKIGILSKGKNKRNV